MTNHPLEIINFNQINILSEFDYVEEIVDNIVHFYLGTLREFVVIATKNLADRNRAQIFFEKTSLVEIIKCMDDVFAGKLRDHNDNYFELKKGKDFLLVGVRATQPHTSLVPIIKFLLKNIRHAELDGLEMGGWDLTMSMETGERMLAEFKQIKDKI